MNLYAKLLEIEKRLIAIEAMLTELMQKRGRRGTGS